MTIKAVRAQILLGDIPLNVYQLPSGRYKLAGRNVTDVAGEPNNSLIRAMGVKSLKDLPGADLSLIQVKADTGEIFIAVAIEDAAAYWGKMAIAGNVLAVGILVASAIEAIERRADAAFGNEKSEGERNERFAKNRVLDFPSPGDPIFESWFESQIERITGFHKNDIRNGKFYWQFVYCWLTPEERCQLELINPVTSTGRRREKIHNCLTAETKERLMPLQLKLGSKMESCKSTRELQRMIARANGVDQPDIFDGFDWSWT
jgi:hypothetical protein